MLKLAVNAQGGWLVVVTQKMVRKIPIMLQ
jgi:hypothetical protein